MGIADLRGAVGFFRKESTAVSRAFVHTDTAKEGLHRSRQTSLSCKSLEWIRMTRIKWHYVIDKILGDTQLISFDSFDYAPGQLVTAVAVVVSSIAGRKS